MPQQIEINPQFAKALELIGFISICCGMAFPVVKFENDDSIIIGLNK